MLSRLVCFRWRDTVKGHDCVVCPYHGWAFDMEGRLRDVPASESDKEWPKKPLIESYHVKEKVTLERSWNESVTFQDMNEKQLLGPRGILSIHMCWRNKNSWLSSLSFEVGWLKLEQLFYLQTSPGHCLSFRCNFAKVQLLPNRGDVIQKCTRIQRMV